MNDRQQDWEWLRDYARRADQAAFGALVRRHINLVYATALRKLEDPGAAQEVAQNVFTALARKAWQFAPDDSVPAWLYRTTLLECSGWLRGELRRRRREQTAAQLGTTMNTPDQEPALRTLLPLLDEGLLALSERDRTALLLRYYESRSLGEVGAALGVSEDAARKRVGTALELLSRFFQRRGFKTATLAATTAALQQTAASAPATMVLSVCQAATGAAPAVLGWTSLLSRFTGLTKLQTAALSLSLAVLPIGWQWHQRYLARHETMQAQAAFEQVLDEEQTLVSGLEKLRSQSARVDAALAKATRLRSSFRSPGIDLNAFKNRLFGMLTDPNYRWQDDIPFVRIRKSDLKELGPGSAFRKAGGIEDWGAELLGLSSQERSELETILKTHSDNLAEAAAEGTYVTNYVVPELTEKVNGKIYRSVYVPPVDAGGSGSIQDGLRAEVSKVLGEARTDLLLQGHGKTPDTLWLRGNGPGKTGAIITVCVAPEDRGEMEYGVYWNGSGGGGTSPNRSEVNLYSVPKPIAARFFDPWLENMGITNLATRGNL